VLPTQKKKKLGVYHTEGVKQADSGKHREEDLGGSKGVKKWVVGLVVCVKVSEGNEKKKACKSVGNVENKGLGEIQCQGGKSVGAGDLSLLSSRVPGGPATELQTLRVRA